MTVTIETNDRIPVEVNFQCTQCYRTAYRVNIIFGKSPMIDEAASAGYRLEGSELFCGACAAELHQGWTEFEQLVSHAAR